VRFRVAGQKLKNIAVRAEVAVNRLLGREFIPVDVGAFNIETTSVCNLNCRFCAYEKKLSPRVTMANDTFADVVEQAVALGFDRFHLTPCTGDVFMDRHLLEKLRYLDGHPKVRGYHFFSNLTIPTHETLLRLMALEKFERMVISVYGHDEASFVAITKASPKIYRRLLANLKTILAHHGRWPFRVSIGHRSSFDAVASEASELMKLLARCKRAGIAVNASHGMYNNWGGYVTQRDVDGLNMYVTPADGTVKAGACVKLFDSVQVMANGVVNACACRDVDATLAIGNIESEPLADILSARNAEYRRIIDEQQAGNFRPVCKGCDFYRSIYHQPKSYRQGRVPVQTIVEYLAAIEQRARTQRSTAEARTAQRPVRPPAGRTGAAR
jgi:sulfatase maturation enzyme AslB (radical SAM superfamily)